MQLPYVNSGIEVLKVLQYMCMLQQQVEYKSFFFFLFFLCTCRCWEDLFSSADLHLLPVWLTSLLHVLLRLPQQQHKTLLS